MSTRFVLILRPEGALSKRVECPLTVKVLKGAKQYASQWAADVGVSGTIEVSTPETHYIAVATVTNSRITKWE